MKTVHYSIIAIIFFISILGDVTLSVDSARHSYLNNLQGNSIKMTLG
jgi:hypothetical protein